MSINCFKKELAPKLKDYKLTYSSFPSGDFGSLERVVIEGKSKIAGIFGRKVGLKLIFMIYF